MIIGIISDTHGQTGRLRRALQTLHERSAAAIVHCGDLGCRECLEEMQNSGLPCYAVAGNMDALMDDLAEYARRCGVTFGQDFVCLSCGDGKTLAATHGNNPSVLAQLAAQSHAYLCHGHTHIRRDERIDHMRIINPGALHHAHPFTVALLDTDGDTVEFLQIK